MRSFNVRPYRPEDLEALIALYIACFREPPWLEVFTPEEVRADFEEILSWPEAIFLVAVDGLGRVIGAGIGFHVCRKADVYGLIQPWLRSSFYVAELFVEPTARARGVCHALAVHLLYRASQHMFLSATVRTSVDQRAIQHLFVGRFGFYRLGEEQVVSRKYIDGETRDVADTRVLMGQRYTLDWVHKIYYELNPVPRAPANSSGGSCEH